MPKRICRSARITLGGHDISDRVKSFIINGTVGEVYMVDLLVTDVGEPWLEIEDSTPRNRAVGSHTTIKVHGTDISDHIAGYDLVRDAGKVRQVRLRVQADEDVITINGTTPWVES